MKQSKFQGSTIGGQECVLDYKLLPNLQLSQSIVQQSPAQTSNLTLDYIK
jgi:hypothetical protein